MKLSQRNSIQFGLGLRRENIDAIQAGLPQTLDCLEIHPENYLGSGGPVYRQFRSLLEHYPFAYHGLSLSLGSRAPLRKDFLKKLKAFLKEVRAEWMSDHLCFATVEGFQTHDLLPLPLSREAIRHVVPRIRQIQDYLEMPFAVENVSYYASGGKDEMPEWEFVSEVVERAHCSLLFDVNNVYVNSVNHGFAPYTYLKAVPYDRVLHVHVAGHLRYQDFLIDTHGAPIIDPVWEMLAYVARRARPRAVIVERDNNVPELAESLAEVAKAREIFQAAAGMSVLAAEAPKSSLMSSAPSQERRAAGALR
ncbi:MAG TPA: hypothetical protein DF383_09080 [Deltaproteobacteria bacterium]|nr:hypothetical protein [Deltaproteobacteria bacterium]